jgi:hypothetical protein
LFSPVATQLEGFEDEMYQHKRSHLIKMRNLKQLDLKQLNLKNKSFAKELSLVSNSPDSL